MFRVAGVAAIACCMLSGCTRAISRGPIIDRYKAAECVSPKTPQNNSANPQSWDSTIELTDKSQVQVEGATLPGGRINVHYLATGQTAEAANAGDYVYPADVRIDRRRDLLYVRASGLAGGIWHETWLFEFDLRQKMLLQRHRVKDEVLPPVCPGTAAPQ